MPLDFQNVQIALGQGVDTKTDPKQVQNKLLDLQNAVFTTGMEIKKPNGYAAFPALSNGCGIASYNSELVSLDGANLYSLDVNGSTQINKGALVTTSLSTTTVVRTTTQQVTQDSAINGTLQCFTWIDSSAGLSYSVFDTATGQSIVNNSAISSTAVTAKVMSIGVYFVIIYSDTGTTLKYNSINTTTPTSISGSTTIASDLNATNVFDATILGTNIGLAYDKAATGVGLYTLSNVLVLSSPTTVSTDVGLQCLTIFADAGDSRFWVAYANSSNVLKYFVRTSTLTSYLAVTTIGTIAQALTNITGVVSSGAAKIVFGNYAALSYNRFVSGVNANDAGTYDSGPTVFKRSVGIASKAFSYGGNLFFWITFSSPLQPTYFLLEVVGSFTSLVMPTANIVAKLSPSVGGGLTAAPILPEVNLISGSIYQVASLIKDLLVSVGGTIFTQTGVLSAQVTLTAIAPSKFILGNNLHILGGQVQMYDGGSVVEHGFDVYPEGVTAAYSATGGGGIGPGEQVQVINQYQYSVVYEWTDNQGQSHQSVPSVPTTLQLPSSAGTVTLFTATLTNGTTLASASVIGAGPLYIGMTVTLLTYAGSLPHYPAAWPHGATITGISGSTLSLSGTISGISGSSTVLFVATTTPPGLIFCNPSGDMTSGSSGGTPFAVQGSLTTGASGFYVQGLGLNSGALPPGTFATSLVTNSSITFSNTVIGTTATDATYGSGQAWFIALNGGSVSLTVPTLRLTNKQKVSIAIYRTTCNGTAFFRVTSPTSLLYNSTTADTVSYTDTTGDGTLIGNQELYTTGGQVDNIQIPASNVATTFKSRAIVIPSENQLSWWYSQQVIPGAPVQFSDLFTENIDSRIGKITAVFAMDDKIIFFGPTSIFYVVGSGPTPSGSQNDFSDAQLISTDVGCTNQASIVLMPLGLMFQSPKGIYLLSRDLAASFIGAEVVAFNTQTVTSAQLLNSVNQVEFTTSGGLILLYDYFYKQWSTIPNITAIDSCLYNNQMTYIGSSGAISQETPGLYTNAGAAMLLSMTGNWMSFAGIQGYQRVCELLILGAYKSPHTLTVSIYTDFNFTSPVQVTTIPVLSDPSPLPYQFRVHLENQQCQAMKVVIQESQSGSYGEGFSLSNLALIVGVKQGLNKMTAAQSFG